MVRDHISHSINIIHPLELSHGRNAEVWDTTGKRYIDFIAGIGVLNLGHCNESVVKAIREQAGRMTHTAFNATPHDQYRAYMQGLANFIPLSYPVVGMLTNSGAEAAENALKIIRAATNRSGVLAFDGGFHGRTLATLNLNGKVAPYKQKLGSLPGPVFHLPYPSADTGVSPEQALAALERLVSVEIDVAEIGAVFIEPVQGEGGFLALDAGFARPLRDFCDRHGIVLVLDEVQSGFGRTGERFGFTRLGIEPDLLLVGKSMAGGVPLGAVLGRRELLDALPKGGLGGTYSGNPLACAAGLATLGQMTDANLARWGELQANEIARRHGEWQRRFPCVGRLTGVGAMRGLELINPDGSPAPQHLAYVLSQAREAGLLLMPSGKARNIIRLLAPLTIEPAILDEGLTILEKILAQLN
ncbi:2-aminoadipate transaminase [Pseudomonas chlororaphis]|uniref:2-aminoadipate transaminase n=1 Tax=Pseudomonas chlororaphis TaxID=587753 RepID=UPI001CF40E58|nr:aspartate aminotransferase family protein [Pseudomonas chlororaphis]UCR83850.1 aspartate aminotransferase family protein [Pseudomonas chlororaphis]